MKYFLISVALFTLPTWAQTVVELPVETAKFKVTIAQDDKATVVDQRPVTLAAGQQIVRFDGLTNVLMSSPDKTQIRFVGGGAVTVLEQKSRPLPAYKEVLNFYEGKTIGVVDQQGKSVSGILKRFADGWLLTTNDGILLNPSGTYVLPKLMENPAFSASLEALINAANAGNYTAEAQYFVPGLTWVANYRATLSHPQGGDRLSVQGWLQVTNSSGMNFHDADMNFQIGSLDADGSIIRIPRPINLLRDETRQLNYVSAEFPAITELVASFSHSNFLEPQQQLTPSLSALLKNDAASGLGVLLPTGKLTTWEQTANNTPRRINEQNFDALPIGGAVSLGLSQVKSISVTRTLIASRKLNPRLTEHNIGFEIENHSNVPVTLFVHDSLPVNSKVTDAGIQPEILNAKTMRFKVDVAANDEAKFDVTVQTTS